MFDGGRQAAQRVCTRVGQSSGLDSYSINFIYGVLHITCQPLPPTIFFFART